MKRIKYACILFFILQFFILFLSFHEVYAIPTKTITYDESINRITAYDANASNPFNMQNLYDADKAGTYELEPPKNYTEADGYTALYLDNQPRPAEWGGIRLVYNVSAVSGTVVCRTSGKSSDIEDSSSYLDLLGLGSSGYKYTEIAFRSVNYFYLEIDANEWVEFNIIQLRWGIIWKTDTENYKVDDTEIWVGDDSTTTFFNDTSINILFETNQRRGFKVLNYATLTLGIQNSGYATSKGVNINFNSSFGGFGSRVIEGSSLAHLNLFSCSLKSTYGDLVYDVYVASVGYFFSSDVKIYNCIFDKVHLWASYSVDAYNVVFLRGLYGLGITMGTFNQVFIYDCRYLIRFEGASKTTKNVYITTVNTYSTIRYLGGGNPHYVINVEWNGANQWAFDWDEATPTQIFRQYTFNLQLFFHNQTPIENANVTMWDVDNTKVFSYLTDSNGKINEQTISYAYYNQTGGDTPYLNSPHTLNITKEGFQTYHSVFNITTAMDLTLTLNPVSDIPEGFHYAIFGLVIALPITLIFGVALSKK